MKRRSDVWVDHEVILLDSAFSLLDEIAVIERRQTSVEQLVERALSRSSTTPERLGTAASGFAAEIEALLRPLSTDGLLTEVIATYALIARRPRPMSASFHSWEARKLLRAARVGTLATVADGQPFASLVTPACAPDLSLLLLLSDLSEHTRHLRAEPRCSVLVAGAPEDANPQTAPRVTVTGLAERIVDPALKARYLAVHPYAALYADFGDFSLWRIRPLGGLYVGGFARAARLRAAELTPDPACRRRHRRGGERDHGALQRRSPGCVGCHRRLAWRLADGGGRCRWLRPRARRAGDPHPLVGAGG